MGWFGFGDDNKNQQQTATSGASGGDPRGRVQNQIQYQQNRYEGQQNPMYDAMAYNYGRGSEADYGNATDIMNIYRSIAQGGGSGGSSGGGGGGGGPVSSFSAHTVSPRQVGVERASVRSLGPLERVKASDPFESYKGYQEFGQTGGYSPQDIANMRARGMAPIRAAYANAERGIGQQRGLQGGYSPNAIAAQVKMAREQGQGMADAATNVEAGIAQARNQGRLAGYGGMAGIEGQRLGAQMQGDIFNAGQANEGQKFDISNELSNSQFNAGQGNQMGQFNADLDYRGQVYNADAYAQADARNAAAAESAANRSYASSQDDIRNRLAAAQGMTSLYGTTPGASQLFGDQLFNAVGQSGTFGQNQIQYEQQGQSLPGQYDTTMGRARDIVNTGTQWAAPLIDAWQNRNRGTQPQGGGIGPSPTYTPPPIQSPYGPVSFGGNTANPTNVSGGQYNPFGGPTRSTTQQRLFGN